ncbi:GNAT family N-acetyltransferase [Flavobacterium sp.]|uniref:GNAT family N-acetyltransferase n=1 Tax=Flavobacterium sp. TaxID=239 RepID=UPI004033D8EE
MNELIISQASDKDLDVLEKIGRETFFETFADSNSPHDMQEYLDKNFSPEKIKEELGDPGSGFYILWDGGYPAGYLKVNSGNAQTEVKRDDSLEIERIYVRSAYFGKKAGQQLYEKALEIAYDQKKTFIWLGVWEKNPRAIRFYEKNGFSAFDKHIFKMGSDEQTDIMMRKYLSGK